MATVARAPNGRLIVGTLEKLAGRANTVVGSFERDENGKLTFEYEGYTEVFWEEQRTVHKHGALWVHPSSWMRTGSNGKKRKYCFRRNDARQQRWQRSR